MLNTFRKAALVLALMGTGLVASSVSAHHSTAAYDYTKHLTLTGTVSKFQWTNPHMFIELVTQDGDKVAHWDIECGTPNINVRQGWKPTDLKVGDKVTVEISPLRTGENGGTLLWVQLSDGRTLRGPAASVVPGPAGPH